MKREYRADNETTKRGKSKIMKEWMKVRKGATDNQISFIHSMMKQ